MHLVVSNAVSCFTRSRKVVGLRSLVSAVYLLTVLEFTYVNLQKIVSSSTFSTYTVMPVPIQGCSEIVM
jgi:hypothetical protein